METNEKVKITLRPYENQYNLFRLFFLQIEGMSACDNHWWLALIASIGLWVFSLESQPAL